MTESQRCTNCGIYSNGLIKGYCSSCYTNKTEPKIWKEWEEVAKDNLYTLDLEIEKMSFFHIVVVKYQSLEKFHLNVKILGNTNDCWSFKTKEQAMLKAQELILKEYKKIQKVMRDKE